MAELPILPLKTDALLADTTHMSAEEFGVYCRILFVMWRQGGKLRDDDSEMAVIGGVTIKRWKAIREKVMRPMTAIGGLVSQGRLTDTWMQVQELRKKRALASDVRWKSKRQPNGMQMHQQVESNSNANQISKIDSSLLTSSFLGAAREEEKQDGSLATALVDSALREPKEERKQAATKGIPVSDELLATLARRR
jgi:uncharacterized protein YdaU (DUF1376 family)